MASEAPLSAKSRSSSKTPPAGSGRSTARPESAVSESAPPSARSAVTGVTSAAPTARTAYTEATEAQSAQPSARSAYTSAQPTARYAAWVHTYCPASSSAV